ncbi:protein lin-9 homolog [Galendromus occidentalis]|uniref:Protein lin-9 homolog n=1 Tax=Galendromus occidentalis TaxID=34638 RepID=A0AAJ7PB13_9ACAR|nr:protein lin-9 homolog [Galendromus occidentalis]
MEDEESPRKSLPILNVSERPTRNRKRNSRFFNDDEDTSWMNRSPRKRGAQFTVTPPGTPKYNIHSSKREEKTTLQEKAIGHIPPAGPLVKTKQRISSLRGPDRSVLSAASSKLKNFLKLPKAHKWVMYEFFYSNIDDCLFNQENEFSSYLKQSFPFLKTRNLTRTEWSRIRRFMGKPRRCSAAFFDEEVRALHEKRELIRHLQQRLIDKLEHVEHLPPEIPLSLVIGTKVMAYVHEKDGLFVGTIDAVDTQSATYRISFDRPEVGIVTCPDFEVLSLQRVERMPIEYFIQRPRMQPAPRTFFPSSLKNDGDPLLSSSISDSRFGSGFPLEFLSLVVTLTRVLSDKKRKIEKLKEMNYLAERSVLNKNLVSVPFKKRYAMILLDLSQLNHDLEECLEGIHKYSEEMQPDQDHSLLSHPLALKARATSEAKNTVALNNGDPPMVANEAHLDLIQNLMIILLQVKTATEKKQATFELRSLKEAIKDLQSKVSPSSMIVYENEVEVHLVHIQHLLTKKAEENLRARMENIVEDKK